MLPFLRHFLAAAGLLAGLGQARPGRAQGTDTLALAQQLTSAKQFGPAAALLARYEQAHPTSTDAVRLHLQLLGWQHRLPEAAALYGLASRRQPPAPSLQLDYGRLLYEARQYAPARAVLEPLLLQEPANVEALTMLGIMQYEAGHAARATAYLNRVLALYPDNPTARQFAAKIRAARAPYLQLYNTYRRDDQPLTWLETKVEAGAYRSALLTPSLQAVLWNTRDATGGFRPHAQVLLGNKSTLLGQRLTAQLYAGFFKHAAATAPAFVGSATLRYQLPRGFGAEVAASRSPYFYTIASGREQVLFGQGYGALLFQSGKGWQGRVQAGESVYPGGNHVLGLSAWGLSRARALGPVYVKGGYSFAYNNAQYNTYAPVQATADLLAAYPAPVAGTYAGYFTPTRQLIHSLLLNVDVRAGRRCWVSVKGSVGVYARAQNPYLFLSESQAGYYVAQGFYPERYTPFELKGQVSYALTDHLGLEGGYGHNRAFFYTANQTFVNAKFTF